MQNYKKYGIRPAQLIIADVPYNIGNNFYGSNPMWYVGGDNKNGESELAGKEFFDTDLLKTMLEEHVAGRKNNARVIYTVLSFLIWDGQYFVLR